MGINAQCLIMGQNIKILVDPNEARGDYRHVSGHLPSAKLFEELRDTNPSMLAMLQGGENDTERNCSLALGRTARVGIR
jgi:hypothetical protein